jgi:hypothetical protein
MKNFTYGFIVAVLSCSLIAWLKLHNGTWRATSKNTVCFSVHDFGQQWEVTCRKIATKETWQAMCKDEPQPLP